MSRVLGRWGHVTYTRQCQATRLFDASQCVTITSSTCILGILCHGWVDHVKIVGTVVQEHQVRCTSSGTQVPVSRLDSWEVGGVGQVFWFWEGEESGHCFCGSRGKVGWLLCSLRGWGRLSTVLLMRWGLFPVKELRPAGCWLCSLRCLSKLGPPLPRRSQVGLPICQYSKACPTHCRLNHPVGPPRCTVQAR